MSIPPGCWYLLFILALMLFAVAPYIVLYVLVAIRDKLRRRP